MLTNKTAKKKVKHEGHVKEAERTASLESVSRRRSTAVLPDRAENQGFRMVCSGGAKQMAFYEQQKLGPSPYYDKSVLGAGDGIHMTNRRQLCVWWDNQKLFATKASLRTVVQIIYNMLVRLGYA